MRSSIFLLLIVSVDLQISVLVNFIHISLNNSKNKQPQETDEEVTDYQIIRIIFNPLPKDGQRHFNVWLILKVRDSYAGLRCFFRGGVGRLPLKYLVDSGGF